MPEADLFKQQRDVVRAFRQIVVARARAESEAVARQEAGLLEANETLDRIRSVAESELANSEDEARDLYDAERQVAEAELANALQENDTRTQQTKQRVETQYQMEHQAADESLTQALREAASGLESDETQIDTEFQTRRSTTILIRSEAQRHAEAELKKAESALHEPGFYLSSADLRSLLVFVEKAQAEPDQDWLKADASAIVAEFNGSAHTSLDLAKALESHSTAAERAAATAVDDVHILMGWRHVRMRRLQWVGGAIALAILIAVVFGVQQNASQNQQAMAVGETAAQVYSTVVLQATVIARPPVTQMDVYADQEWQDSGIYVREGEALNVAQTSGTWSYCVNYGCPYVDGQGIPDSLDSTANVIGPCPHAALIIQFEDKQSHITKLECIQKEYAGVAPASGIMSFRINDSVIDDNAGSLGVVIQVGPGNETAAKTLVAATATAVSHASATATAVAEDFHLVSQDTNEQPDEVINDDDNFRHSITAGRDRWEVKPGNCAGWWFWGGDQSGNRFSLAQDVDIVSGPADAEVSLMFRRTGNDHYLISIRDNQFTVRRYQTDHFVSLIDWTTTDAIHRNQMNHVLVLGDGPRFQFYINDEPVGTVVDATVPEGVVGIHMYGSCPADQPAVFEFDNFELRAP